MTGHFHRSTLLILFVLLPLLTLPAQEAQAFEVTLSTSNDFFSGSEEDDLYTADLGFDLRWGNRQVMVGERLFTDREQGHRFDETYAATRLPIPRWGRWQTRLDVGILHVGRGLLGEDAQNAVHRLFDLDEVDLDYVAVDDWHPTAQLSLERPLTRGAGPLVAAEVSAFTAPGFRTWVRAAVAGQWHVRDNVTLHASVGAMVNHVALDELDARVNTIDATWRVGVAYRGLTATWTYNQYGTSARHFSLGYQLGLGSDSRTRNR